MSAPTNSRKTPHRNDPMTDVILATVAEATAGLRLKLADAERQRDEARDCLNTIKLLADNGMIHCRAGTRVGTIMRHIRANVNALLTPKPTR